MGGGPHHHQGKQPPTTQTEMPGGGGGAHQWRDRTGHAADHDVLGGAWLEQHRVEQHVAAQAEQGQAGGEAVDPAH